MTNTREDKVQEFMDAAGTGTLITKPENLEMVWTCFHEEVDELVEADIEYHLATGEDPKLRANFVKELGDVQYVLCQLANYYEVDLQKVFDIVADNNLTKVINGKIIRRPDGKILKPDGYTPVTMEDLNGF